MGCRNDYMEPNAAELEAGKIEMLLEELKTGKHVSGNYNSHNIHNVSQEKLDKMTAKLCKKLQKKDDVSECSLELQMWWRNHQAADRQRVEDELKAHQDEEERQAAIDKLSPHERDLLGL